MDFFIGLGYFGLFLGAFLAGSIVPFSSEILLGALLAGGGDPLICLIAVTLGNTMGGMTCYYLGRMGKQEWLEKYFKFKPETIDKYREKIKKNGAFMALFSWLPYVGEAISISLGFSKTPALPVSVFMLIGKLGRFVVMLLAIQGLIAWF